MSAPKTSTDVELDERGLTVVEDGSGQRELHCTCGAFVRTHAWGGRRVYMGNRIVMTQMGHKVNCENFDQFLAAGHGRGS